MTPGPTSVLDVEDSSPVWQQLQRSLRDAGTEALWLDPLSRGRWPGQGDLRTRQLFAIAVRDGGFDCRYCDVALTPQTAHREHLTPKSAGGSDKPSNLGLSCITCNNTKGSRTVAEWLAAWPEDKADAYRRRFTDQEAEPRAVPADPAPERQPGTQIGFSDGVGGQAQIWITHEGSLGFSVRSDGLNGVRDCVLSDPLALARLAVWASDALRAGPDAWLPPPDQVDF